MNGTAGRHLAELIVGASARVFDLPEDPMYRQLLGVRAAQRKFYPTWASAMEALGHRIGGTWDAELALLRDRRRRFSEVAAAAADAAGATVVKGGALAALYPDPIERYSDDLDLHVADLEGLWNVGKRLREQGWEAFTLVLNPRQPGSEPDALLQLCRQRPTVDDPPDCVEVSTLLLQGDGLRMDRVRDLPGLGSPARQLAAVAAEGIERPFGLRDLVDAHVVLETVDHHQLGELRVAADTVGLGPYLRRLLRRTKAVLGTPVSEALCAGAVRPPARRVGTALARLCAPGAGGWLRLAQTVATYHRNPWTVGVLDRLAAGTAAAEALDKGASIFCRPGRGPVADGLSIGGRSEIMTPLGTFVALAGTVIPDDVAARHGIGR